MLALETLSLGLQPYQEVWKLQKELHREVVERSRPHTLILCEHPAVITIGKSGRKEHLLTSEKGLTEKQIEFFEVERGGDITLHSPGQLIAYPILDLRKLKTDVNWYLRGLEQVLISVLRHYDITGVQVEGKTGVWIAERVYHKKIASLGVRLSRWCSYHGVSLNASNDLSLFSNIVPCGIQGAEMTSIAELLGHAPDNKELEEKFHKEFCGYFGFEPQTMEHMQEL